jgi:hypothetical protein
MAWLAFKLPSIIVYQHVYVACHAYVSTVLFTTLLCSSWCFQALKDWASASYLMGAWVYMGLHGFCMGSASHCVFT